MIHLKQFSKFAANAAFLAIPLLAADARTGMAPIGLAAFSTEDVKKLAEVFKACPAKSGCEVAFLSQSFGGYTRAESLVKSVLPAYRDGRKLTVAIYLDDGANRDERPEWCRFRTRTRATDYYRLVSQKDKGLEKEWRDRLARPAAKFITNLTAWAKANRLEEALRFVVLPVLEDSTTAANFKTLLSWTQAAMPAGVTYRRSTTSSPERVPGASLEFHGKGLDPRAQSGDVITPDGENVGDHDWKRAQALAIAKGVSSLWWISDFNSNSSNRSSPPWSRGTLKPFTNDRSLTDRAKAIIRER